MQIVKQVASVTYQVWVFYFFNYNYQIARNAATLARISFIAHAKLHPFSNSGRNINADYFFAMHNTRAVTCLAFVCYDLTLATALRTGSRGLHLAKNRISNSPDLTLPVTGGTCLKR